MTTHNYKTARARLMVATVAAALFSSVAVAQVSSAQTQTTDSRWQAFMGCWVPDAADAAIGTNSVSGSMVCVVPVQNSPSVDIATIHNRVVVNRDRFTVTGERVAKKADDCGGFETSNWSADGHRIYSRSEYKCGTLDVKGSSMFTLSSTGDWLQVQGTAVGLNSGARIVRLRPADVSLAPGSIISDSSVVTTVPAQSSFAQQAMRSAASVPTDAKALLDISKHVDEQVAQAYLSEVGTSIKLNAHELVVLADAGMPSDLTDMMVAMANPERFQLKTRSPDANSNTVSSSAAARADQRCSFGYLDDRRFDLTMSQYDRSYCASRYGSIYGSPFGYLSGYRYGYDRYYGYNGYNGSNYYYGQQPIIIVTRGDGGGIDGGSPAPRGRAVKGGGYSAGGSSSPSSGTSTPRQTSSPSSGSSSSGASSSGSSSGGSGSTTTSSGDAGARTAKPKPPGGN
ncbi:MAG: hypothetical protein ABJB74_18090 [Gemmatimonas sp.]